MIYCDQCGHVYEVLAKHVFIQGQTHRFSLAPIAVTISCHRAYISGIGPDRVLYMVVAYTLDAATVGLGGIRCHPLLQTLAHAAALTLFASGVAADAVVEPRVLEVEGDSLRSSR